MIAETHLSDMFVLLAISSPIISPTTPPNAPEAQSPDFAAPTAQPSKACETLFKIGASTVGFQTTTFPNIFFSIPIILFPYKFCSFFCGCVYG